MNNNTRRVHVSRIYDVLCTRPGPWGNPYTWVQGRTYARFRVKNRHEAVAAFRQYVRITPGMIDKIKAELKGKRLACVCQPDEECHVDVLVDAAEGRLDRPVSALELANNKRGIR